MSIHLKEWYSLAETANYLFSVCSETITELSLITHAIQNNITLSVILPNPEWAFKCDLVDKLEQERGEVVCTWNEKKIVKTDNVTSLSGIYDIPPYAGGGWLLIENKMNELNGCPKRKGTIHDFYAGTYLVDGLGNTYKIKGGINFSEAKKPYNKKREELISEMMIKNVNEDVFDAVLKKHDDEVHKELMEANNTCELPENAHLVIRKTAIDFFIEKYCDLGGSEAYAANKPYTEAPLKNNQAQITSTNDRELSTPSLRDCDLDAEDNRSETERRKEKKREQECFVKNTVAPYLKKTYTTDLIPDIHKHFRDQNNYKKAESLVIATPDNQGAILELNFYKIYDDSTDEKEGVVGSSRRKSDIGKWLKSTGFIIGGDGKQGHAKDLIKRQQ